MYGLHFGIGGGLSRNGKVCQILGKLRLADVENTKLEAAYELEVKEAGGEAVWDGVGGVGEVFDKHVGDGIGPVDEVEDFESGPDIFEITEGAMAAAVAFFAVEQQGAEAYIDADIGIDRKGIAIAQVAGNIERKVTAVEKVEEGLEVFVGCQVVLEEEAEGEEPVGGASYPAGFCFHAVCRLT